MFYSGWSQLPTYDMENNKQVLLTTPTVHYTLPFCIAPWQCIGWLGCCWTWSCTWAWWYVRVQKIFAYEVSEIDGQLTIELHLLVTGWSQMYDKAVTRDVTQNRIMIAYKHFKVIISLYLSLNKRARGLSTLIMTHSEQRAC